jgi:hypothetical protein
VIFLLRIADPDRRRASKNPPPIDQRWVFSKVLRFLPINCS